jgi:hypothetical protein
MENWIGAKITEKEFEYLSQYHESYGTKGLLQKLAKYRLRLLQNIENVDSIIFYAATGDSSYRSIDVLDEEG